MDLDCYDEDNPNLDGDYKAVLQRRREIAEAKKVSRRAAHGFALRAGAAL